MTKGALKAVKDAGGKVEEVIDKVCAANQIVVVIQSQILGSTFTFYT